MRLTISLAQMDVIPSSPRENLEKGERFIAEAARRESDVICFPEMWTTGFHWEKISRRAEEHDRVIERVGTLARKYGIWIVGSMPGLNEEGRVSNTFILFNSQGEPAGTYRKTHLFSLLQEDRYVAPGRSSCLVTTPWGPVGLAICYDIRFPELFRTYALKGAKLVFCPAAFPHPRLDHWKILVRARAVENQMYLVGINQVGSEEMGTHGRITYFGHSVIIDPWGKTVVQAGESQEMLLTATIDPDLVDDIRAGMQVLRDRRPDIYELS
ncbi:MAG: carbon-nitrogen family hydrolase [Syntrophobacteraceae bacterium]|nr:carbon-nitrogen family hydrolase [Syntrophobacteraceae bacterium]